MQVRAQRPSYWVGETFDTWQGRELDGVAARAAARRCARARRSSCRSRWATCRSGRATSRRSTSRVPTANLVFHAESADELWFPSGKVYVAGDGTIVSPIGLGSGSVYTVDSQVSTATPAQLRADDSPFSLSPATLQSRRSSCRTRTPACWPWPGRSPRDDANTYDKVQSLIHWIGAHTHYSENIPPLPPGADTVDEFLFGNRVGFCEQISTSLAVMLRSLGIPAREAVGLRARGLRPDHRPLPGPRRRRPCLGPGVVPRLRLAGLRPDGGRPGRPAQPGRHRAARRRLGPAPHPSGAGRRGPRWPPAWSWSSCAGAGRGRRRGRSGWRAAPSGPVAGPGGPAGPPRPWRNTPAGSDAAAAGARTRTLEPAGLVGGGERLRRARPAPRGRSAPWSCEARRARGRRGGTGGAVAAAPRERHARERLTERPDDAGQLPRRSVPFDVRLRSAHRGWSLSRRVNRPSSEQVGRRARSGSSPPRRSVERSPRFPETSASRRWLARPVLRSTQQVGIHRLTSLIESHGAHERSRRRGRVNGDELD